MSQPKQKRRKMRPEYRIEIRGKIPENLESRISYIHAEALIREYFQNHNNEKNTNSCERIPTNQKQNGSLQKDHNYCKKVKPTIKNDIASQIPTAHKANHHDILEEARYGQSKKEETPF